MPIAYCFASGLPGAETWCAILEVFGRALFWRNDEVTSHVDWRLSTACPLQEP